MKKFNKKSTKNPLNQLQLAQVFDFSSVHLCRFHYIYILLQTMNDICSKITIQLIMDNHKLNNPNALVYVFDNIFIQLQVPYDT